MTLFSDRDLVIKPMTLKLEGDLDTEYEAASLRHSKLKA